jgi:MFS family permease
LLLVYAKTALGYGGAFTAFTFLAPILQQVSGFSAGAVSLILLVYGVSVAVGNIWGGKLADRMGPLPALKLLFAGLAVVLLVLTFTAPHPVLAVLTVLVWGAFAFGNVPGLQVLVVKQAERHTPNAVDVASGLNIAAFNVGIALGSVVGGFVVEHLGLMHTPGLAPSSCCWPTASPMSAKRASAAPPLPDPGQAKGRHPVSAFFMGKMRGSGSLRSSSAAQRASSQSRLTSPQSKANPSPSNQVKYHISR